MGVCAYGVVMVGVWSVGIDREVVVLCGVVARVVGSWREAHASSDRERDGMVIVGCRACVCGGRGLWPRCEGPRPLGEAAAAHGRE